MTALVDLFTDPSWLKRALTHRSYCNEHPDSGPSNERLEFLGDAVLSLIISTRLFRILPNSPEGELTNRRSWLVQTSSLAVKAKELKLNDMLLLSHGEEESGGRQNVGLLANTFEAILGALYLDSGLATCQEFIGQVFSDAELLTDREIKDPKSLLQEAVQAQNRGTPVYKLQSATGPDHARNFVSAVYIGDTKIAEGNGSSKQRAEADAASNALKDVLK